MDVKVIMANLEAKHPGESEYLQAVQEVLESIEEVYNQHPEYEAAKIVERMVEPDRIFTKGFLPVNLSRNANVCSADAKSQAIITSLPIT